MDNQFLKKFQPLFIIIGVSFILFLFSQTYLNIEKAENIVDPSRSITLSATGKTYVLNNIAKINFTAITQGTDSQIVQKENNEQVSNVIKGIKSLGISEKDIKTINYSLRPEYDYNWCKKDKDDFSQCPPKIIGYRLDQSIELTIRDFQKIESVINLLAENQVDQVSGVRFEIEDIEKVKNLARVDALKKIQEQAQVISKETGIRLGKILEINENFVVPYYRSMQASKEEVAPSSSFDVSLEPGQQEITVTLSVKYEIK